ncbi:MAG: amino acid adenylation domain-containing protein, partial [Acidobacteriota bacterium]
MRNIKDLLSSTTTTSNKQKLFEYLLAEEGIVDSETEIISPVKDRDQCPLSFAQQRLWFLDQIDLSNANYNISGALHLQGKFNRWVLEESFNEIIKRHEILRTSFSNNEGNLVQIIHPPQSSNLLLIDLREVPETRRKAETHYLIIEEAKQPFNLSQLPLLRIKLLHLAEYDHVLLVTMHHIISDGWSVEIFARELAAIYKAFLQGKPSPLADLPIQYADYAQWQQEWLQGEVLHKQLDYWRRQLGGELPVLALSIDRPRPSIQSFQGATRSLTLSREVSQALKRLSKQEDVTLFMLMLGAFQVLLYRYSGQEDIIVGTPVANRQRKEVEGLIGFFVNTLVIRTELAGRPSFRELLRRVRKVALEAYAHQDLPFEKLVEELQPDRDLSHNPLFQVMFALESNILATIELPELTMRLLDTDNEIAKFDLSLTVLDNVEILTTVWEYSTSLFDETTIARMMEHFALLLTRLVNDPDQYITQIPILTSTEQYQLLIEWNSTKREYDGENCIHILFEQQVERTPNAIAVIFEDKQLSYYELNQRANQLAHYLRAMGVGPESLVAICVEYSLDMIVGLLGILKAGAAYLPLDPIYAGERLVFMLRDSEAAVLLTQQHIDQDLDKHVEQVVYLDTDWSTIADCSVENPITGVAEDNLAYIIYTSGTTGRPKGVLISHKGVCNRLLWAQETYHLTETDRVLQKASVSFDASVLEFFWPLLAGAGIVMVRPGGQQDSAYLVKLIMMHHVTIIDIVPSLLQVLLDEVDIIACHSIKYIFSGGEILSPELKEQVFAHLTVNLYNTYGPTEASIDVTHSKCEQENRQQAIPIGRAIANIQIYILDTYLQPLPIGVPGELHIGGVGLARGYFKHPDLTAEKFIPNPFSDTTGTRLYKTGDLARYLPDGQIEYLGRLDNQVKIRGFRIELGEIEAVIAQHPAVRESIVLMHEDQPGNKRLIAYLVLKAETLITSAQLREYLKQRMPDYMLPSG